jgi:alkanesulfonate monooxygenase SsuD/methylene tetrahydromethanopterin reductase-like flavin-dependent oxidoreductase (luciferase family)
VIAQQGLTYDQIKRVAVEADKGGFDSIWLYDHLFWSNDPFLECWTTLASLAAQVEKVRLGTLVTCYSNRQPSLLAKMATTLDNLSGGRLILGLGAGTSNPFHEAEEKSYGFPFPKAAVRLDQLREYIEIIKEMWTADEATYSGQHYQVSRAKCFPKPVQKPGPPIIVAGSGKKFLKIAADLADGYNYWGSKEEFAKRTEMLNELCRTRGRDPTTLGKSWHISGVIDKDAERAKERLAYHQKRDIIGEPMFGGTPADWIQLFTEYIQIGVNGFQVWFLDGVSLEPLRLFAQEVIPQLRSLKIAR